MVNAINDSDGVYRRAQPLFNYQGRQLPALSVAALLKDSQTRHILYNALQPRWAERDFTEALAVNYYQDNRPYSMSGILQSISQLQQGDMDNLLIPPDSFTDRYVFIGASAIGLHDLKTLPVLGLAPGVFVHAALLANLIDNDRLFIAAPGIEYTLILALSLTTVFTVLGSRRLPLQIGLPAGLMMLYYFSVLYARHINWQYPLTGPLLAILLTWICAYTYLFATEEKEKKQIRDMFSRYVSPAALALIVDQLEDFKNAASGNRRTVSVLFCDMRGFTTLSERLPAEDLVRILNHYFSVMTEIIFNHGGTIDKFIGDAIMATWGAPLASKTHAMDAVTAALAMLDALPTINGWLADQQLPEVDIGIGIHTGEVIMGSIGSRQKADFTVIGDTVNLASRLEGVTKLYHRPIVISQTTQEAVQHRHKCQLLDCVQVKGKHQSIKIFSPLRRATTETEAETRAETGAETESETESEADAIIQPSQMAFDCYQRRQWQTCLWHLAQIPPAFSLPMLQQACTTYLQSPPGPQWQAVTQLYAK